MRKWRFCSNFGYFEVQIKKCGEIVGYSYIMGIVNINYTANKMIQ